MIAYLLIIPAGIIAVMIAAVWGAMGAAFEEITKEDKEG